MNKITTSSKVALMLTCLVLGISLLYFLFGAFSNGSDNNNGQSPIASNSEGGTSDSTSNPSNPSNAQNNPQEVAPIYSDIESPSPTIQISEDTKNNRQTQQTQQTQQGQQGQQAQSSASGSLPQGFGFVGNQAENDSENTGESASSQLQELPIDLETPTESTESARLTDPTDPSSKDNKNIGTMDPREVGVSANDGPDKDYEETVLTVQRTLTAVNPDGEKQLIRLKIPVMYRSKSLRLEGESKVKAQDILKELKAKGNELAKIKSELEATLVEWNQLVMTSTPYEVLLPESPTLPQNQSAGRLNREDNPSMSAGKAISYEIINKK